MPKKNETPVEEIAQETPTLNAGDCKKDGCKCLHEHGLVDVVDGNGLHSQMTVEHAKNELAKAESIKAALAE